MTTKAVVMRKWHSPVIEAFATDVAVGAGMDIEDFVKALAAEVGSPKWLLSQAALETKLLQAKDKVLEDMKSTTRFVV